MSTHSMKHLYTIYFSKIVVVLGLFREIGSQFCIPNLVLIICHMSYALSISSDISYYLVGIIMSSCYKSVNQR